MLGVFIVTLIVILLFLSIQNYNYWLKRKIKCDIPVPLFGNHFKVLLIMCSYTEHLTDLYRKYPDEKVIGYYRGKTPELIIRDPDLLKSIFNVNFSSFHARGLGRDPEYEPIMFNIFSLDGDRWKLLRNEISSAFSSRKLKNVFPLITNCAEKLQKFVHTLAVNGEEEDANELMARYGIETIGAIGFGINMNTINAERSLYMKLREMTFKMTKKQLFLLGLRDLFPKIKFINKIPISKQEIMKTIIELMNILREQRNYKPSTRNDYVDLLLKLEGRGKIYGKSLDIKDENGDPVEVELEITPTISAAQLFVFLAAGFETSALSTSFTIYQLAYHQEIQNKVHKEIDSVLSKYNNKICYEAISEMSYLEMVFLEAMRIFPPTGYTTRVCTKDYTIPELNLTIEAGTKVVIPISAIHTDPKYYNNPSEFRPERFTPESIRNRQKFVYIPFGEGPRKCIGERLGIIKSLAGIVAILQKCKVEPGPSARRDFKLKSASYLIQAIDGGMPVRFIPRQ